jgi:predicted PurR-regulated permease PerM
MDNDQNARRISVVMPARRPMSLMALFAVVLLLFIFAADVLLVIFAGLLFGVFFDGGGTWLATRIGFARGWGIGLFVLLILAASGGISAAFAPAVIDQFDQLSEQVPAAFEDLRTLVESYSWGEDLLRHASPAAMATGDSGGAATTAVLSTFGALGNFVIMLFIGLYVAIDPSTYRLGLVSLLAPSARVEGEAILAKTTAALQNWLIAQIMAMAVVGIVTWLGLWLLGVPLAPILGLIAALLAFIPNIGPIIAAVPGVLLALSDGPTTALLVLGVYVSVQAFESYLILPLIFQERISLPAALVISVQLLMGVLFGLIGLALATPMAALAMTLTQELYVRRYLDDEVRSATETTDNEGGPLPG